MSSAKRISPLLGKVILLGAIYLIFESAVFSSTAPDLGSINFHPEVLTRIHQNKICFQKPAPGIFRTDSIFSFHSEKGYVPSLIHNIGEQATAPFRFKTKQWLYTGVAAGITTVLILADEDIDEWARTQKQKNQWVKKASPVITEFGSNYGIYSVIADGLISALFKNEKGVQTSLLATQAAITSGIWAQIIKQLSGRERPKASYIFSQTEGGRWHGAFAKYLEMNPDDRSKFSYDAFPSGHTATAFSIATVFALQYKDTKIVPVLFYSAATLVGISRLTEHEHWSSDVFVGGLLGYLAGKQVVSHFNKTHLSSPPSIRSIKNYNREISFIQHDNQIGFSIIW